MISLLKATLRNHLPPPAYARLAVAYRAVNKAIGVQAPAAPTASAAVPPLPVAEPEALATVAAVPAKPAEEPVISAPALTASDVISVEEKRRVATEKFWHYPHDLGDGVVTTPWWDWLPYWHDVRRQAIFGRVHEIFGPSLKGLRCLDVACNSGFWSFELIDRGADSVYAFDVTDPLVDSAQFVRNCRKDKPEYQRVEFHVADYHDVQLPDNGFDLVLALGMMYHLTDVYGVAQRLTRATGRVAIIDSSVSDQPGDVLEIPPEGKYFWISKGEFSFVPSRGALRRIFQQAGFAKVTPWMPEEGHPCYKEYGPNGFRHILVCEK